MKKTTLKKMTATLLFSFLLLASAQITAYTPLFSSVGNAAVMGDIDKNGSVTAEDARLVLRASVGLEKFGEYEKCNGDLDGDSKITAADARLVLRTAVGLEKVKSECIHKWTAATCTTPKTCSVCKRTTGSALGHNLVGGECTRCGLQTDEYNKNYNYLKKKADNIVFSCATTALRSELKNPNTLTVLNQEIKEEDKYFRYIIKFSYTAQNNVGGYVTDYAYFLIQVNSKMDGTFFYTTSTLGMKYLILDSDKERFGWGTKPDNFSLAAIERNTNPEEVSLKLIVAYPEKYVGKYVKLKEKYVIVSNNVADKYFYGMRSTGDDIYDYDSSTYLNVYYDLVDNIEECIMIDANYQKVTVYGTVKTYSNSTSPYIDADKIVFE